MAAADAVPTGPERDTDEPGSSKVSPRPCARAASLEAPRERTLAADGLATSVADCANPSGRALDVTCVDWDGRIGCVR